MGSSGNKRALGMVILFLAVFGGSGLILGILTGQVVLVVMGALALLGALLLQSRVRKSAEARSCSACARSHRPRATPAKRGRASTDGPTGC